MRAALITGAAGGIGRALTTAFAETGWRVIATDRAGEAQAAHAFLPADLAALALDEQALDTFARAVRAAAHGAPIAAIVNNAAVQTLAPTRALSTRAVIDSLTVNVAAPFALVRAFLDDLEAGSGAVVNIGSVHAQATKPEFAAYATSKAALHGLTRALAVDLGPKVRVNTLAPAAVGTEMLVAGFEGRPEAFAALEAVHPAQRIASPAEIARIAVFLASPEAGFLTGATLFADGGILSRLHDPV